MFLAVVALTSGLSVVMLVGRAIADPLTEMREVVEADTLPDYRMILDDTDKVVFYVKNPRRLSAGIAKTVTA